MRKRKKNKKILLILLIIIVIYYIGKTNLLRDTKVFLEKTINMFFYDEEYKTIKLDNNKNYDGKGQEKVKDKDGYFTTFSTIEKNKKRYIEYKQNGSSSWSNKQYWGGTMSENGCGITAISIILSGYNKDYTPEDLRKKYSPVLNSDDMSKELSNTFKIKNSDFYFDSTHISKKSIVEHLETNRPILICVWNQPSENRWTTSSHYMVLLATDGQDKVYVSNPNGLENNSKSSGWYELDEVVPYIAKILYIEEY